MSRSEIGTLQDLQAISVELRTVDNRLTCGTGVIASRNGVILTCVHVVQQALSKHPREATEKDVLPIQVHGRTEPMLAAVAYALPHPYEDDLVLLKIVEPKEIYFSQDQIAVIGPTATSEGSPFISYGFAKHTGYGTYRTNGTILGSVTPPQDASYRSHPIQLTTFGIPIGMSGGAILDTNRNLVVGLISERWAGENSSSNTTGWGIGLELLAEPEFHSYELAIETDKLSRPARMFPTGDITALASLLHKMRAEAFHGAPSIAQGQIERRSLTQELTEIYLSKSHTIVGLVGLGGEGKTNLARICIDKFVNHETLKPESIFWWSFSDGSPVVEFLSAALAFISNGQINAATLGTLTNQAATLAQLAILRGSIFVLDGVDALQKQQGSDLGILSSSEIANFLRVIASQQSDCFCLVTSRLPLVDLTSFDTYAEIALSGFTDDEGVLLLQEMGVLGSRIELTKVVTEWNGTPLALRLVGSYILNTFSGEVAAADTLRLAKGFPDFSGKLTFLLEEYSKHLTVVESRFLSAFSLFRKPMSDDEIETLFASKAFQETLSTNKRTTSIEDIRKCLASVLKRFLISQIDVSGKQHYVMHPIVRQFYLRQVDVLGTRIVKSLHLAIASHYTSLVSPKELFERLQSNNVSIDDFARYGEMVHHSCRAGHTDLIYQGFNLVTYQGKRGLTTFELGAYDFQLSLLAEFFDKADINNRLLLSGRFHRRFVLHEVGRCLVFVGKLTDAIGLFERAIEEDQGDIINASISYQNLWQTYLYLGDLDKAMIAISRAITLGEQAQNTISSFMETSQGRERVRELIGDERDYENMVGNPRDYQKDALFTMDYGVMGSYSCRAYIKFLQGDVKGATEDYHQSKLRDKSGKANYSRGSTFGLRYAEYLIRSNRFSHARRTIKNIMSPNKDKSEIAKGHILLGRLAQHLGAQDDARREFTLGCQVAQTISDRGTQIEAYLAYGLWKAQFELNPTDAYTELNEAARYSRIGRYYYYEIQSQLGEAWVKYRTGKQDEAIQICAKVREASSRMNYYWTSKDVDELISQIH